MSDPQDPTAATGDAGSTGGHGPDGGNGAPGRNVNVNWRGIVDDDTPPLKTARITHGIGHAVSSVLVALGLKRARRADGTRAPRPWGRVAVIWGGAFVVLVLWSAGHIVSAGNVGVPVTFGEAGDPLSAGLHFTAPWPITRVTQMSSRTQNYTMSATPGEGQVEGDDSVTVLGRDGATAQVDATVLYRVEPQNATTVYETVGTRFTTSIIRPSARACIRTAFTSRNLVDASTQDWPEISAGIAECMRSKIEPRGITLEDFQLRDVRLSPQVQQAIEASVAASETGGSELSQAYLQFAYIQALRAFAESQGNTTLVLPGNGEQVQPVLPVPGGDSAATSTTVAP